ncbi:2-keto-4-pentenoate hydratase/2-oxohepta-3-ene-1,7-dioic acid hydratase in catechol pathway [Neorhizobium galegae]|uniref:hypothetical protein n=1 Tax=Neorhizobium galegae TaxID=399 RepID=UPI001AE6C532|nr:hypothetical protein [Neorhizobium galegae]MBP2557346.1 2-keto-4-pentenoate hydratase/2-oxohepta-3-ene-1,7-dioic acid hydratase in catechol pathway [Neorhizobium galegae]
MPDMPTDTLPARLANAICNSILSRTVLDPEPFLGLPLAEAYAVQRDVFHALGQPFKGAKLTLKGDFCQSAPLLSVNEETSHAHQPGISLEVELAFVLGKDVVARHGEVARQDIVDAIGSVRIGVELLRSRYQGGSRGDPALAAADMMSNVGYVLGPPLDRSLLDEGASIGQLSVFIDGQSGFDKPAAHADGDPLKTMVVLANQNQLSSFSMLKAGQVMTTGTLCGLIPIAEPGRIEVNMGGQRFVLDLI